MNREQALEKARAFMFTVVNPRTLADLLLSVDREAREDCKRKVYEASSMVAAIRVIRATITPAEKP